MKLEWDQAGWDQIAKEAIAAEGVPRMQRVADACNADDGLTDGYRVSTEGENPLTKHDFRATVITATERSIRSNARKNTLIRNFSQASGD